MVPHSTELSVVPTPQERGCFISSQIYESLKKGSYFDMILNPERWETLLPIAFQKSVTVLVNASTGKKSLSQRGKFNKLIFCTDMGRVEWKNEGILQPPKAAKLCHLLILQSKMVRGKATLHDGCGCGKSSDKDNSLLEVCSIWHWLLRKKVHT